MTGLREAVRRMSGYAPGEQLNASDIVKLNTNENPYPPSPSVFDAIRAALTSDTLRKYPPPLGDDFRRAAARVLNVAPDAILIGNGSDDILTILTRAFVPEGGLVAAMTPSYSLYRTLAELQGARLEAVPWANHWQIPEPWPINNANIFFLPNPNSPSGTIVDHASIASLAASLNGPLVLDEAYADFAECNGLTLLKTVPNLIITRTFSKYYALAGVRFGFAIADPATIRELEKVKDSYNCDSLSLAAATAAIEDQDYYLNLRARILQSRSRLQSAFQALGFAVTPSHANFLWCRRTDRPVRPIYEALKARGILIRHMNYEGYGDGLRISVGTDAEIDRLLEAISSA